ncbi:phosphohistidine phosphatase SixA [Rheinheimera gaetbuli]
MRYWQLRLAPTFIIIAHNFLPGVLLSATRKLTGNPEQYGVILMVNLVIMRHGEAEPLSSLDSQRQLTARGQQEVNQMALWLQQHYAAFDWIWASPYLRASQTAELMLAKQAPFSQFEIVPELVPDGDAAMFKSYFDARVSENPDARVLLVSHMPLVSFLVEAFTMPGNAPVFSTAQLACIDYRPQSAGRLLERLSPQELALISV